MQHDDGLTESLCLCQSSSTALEQEIRERATVLQTEFENFVHSDPESVQKAKKGRVHLFHRHSELRVCDLNVPVTAQLVINVHYIQHERLVQSQKSVSFYYKNCFLYV